MIRRQETAAPRNFPPSAWRDSAPGRSAASGSNHKRERLGTGASRALATRLGSSAGHRVVVTVCKSPLVVSALMEVRSTAPQGVGAQALSLPWEYLVGWLSGPRIWTFACG